MDFSPLLSLLKGKHSETEKFIIAGFKVLYEQQGKANKQSAIDITKLKQQINNLEKKLSVVTRMEEDCLDQNVKSNELIRNLVEYIIFEERRVDIAKNISLLLKQ